MLLIHWFRRDLRLHDNPALYAALQQATGRVVPVFILDDTLLNADRTSAARVVFMLDALHALDAALREHGSRLVVRHGPTQATLLTLYDELAATGIFWNRDYTPFAKRRDGAIEQAVQARGGQTRQFSEAVISEPNTILSGAGTPYTVYTPYYRRWRGEIEGQKDAILSETALPSFQPLPEAVPETTLLTAHDLGITTTQQLPPGGEAAGLTRLHAFAQLELPYSITNYAAARNLPALPATSKLSPYLRFGCVAPRRALRTALHALDQTTTTEQRQGIETWIGELAWRDFYYQILANFPHVLTGAFKPSYNQIAWENNANWFEAWCNGQTGYPIVDAAMRQLQHEAWMHNRCRMIVASFLTKDLLIDWRWGERFFMQQLVDGDHASNNGGWQWAAGTGTDAQPYFRIFNPVSQGEKFDPQGSYVRRYLPELSKVPDRYLHAPWTMPPAIQRQIGVEIGQHYPRPIVDHAQQRQKALHLYKAVRATE